MRPRATDLHQDRNDQVRAEIAAGMNGVLSLVDAPLMPVGDVRQRVTVDVTILNDKTQALPFFEGQFQRAILQYRAWSVPRCSGVQSPHADGKDG